jgi:hypothetical protein
VALPAQPARAVVPTAVEVEIINDPTNRFLESFKLGMSACEVVYIEVERWTRQPALAKSVKAIYTEAVEDFLNFAIVNDDLVSCCIDRPSSGYDILHGAGDFSIGEPETDYLLMCGVKVVFVLD